MKTQRITKSIIVASVILLIGGTIAFAQGGWGGRGYDGDTKGPGYGCPGRGDCPGWGNRAGVSDLTDEEAAQIDAAREKFFAETKDLRTQMRNLRTDLRDEMTKEAPDEATVLELQKELSGIKADFDQKRVQHRLEMRKIAPEKFQERGFGRGYGRGYGRGGGGCWR